MNEQKDIERCYGTPGNPNWQQPETENLPRGVWHPHNELCGFPVKCSPCPGCPDCETDEEAIVRLEGVPSEELLENMDTPPGSQRCKWDEAQENPIRVKDRRIEELEAEVKDYQQRLGNLLARIHGDGGHYISKHGWEKAEADADMLVVNLRVHIEEQETRNAVLNDILDSFGFQLGLWGWSDQNKTMLQAMQDGVAVLRNRIAELEEKLATLQQTYQEFQATYGLTLETDNPDKPGTLGFLLAENAAMREVLTFYADPWKAEPGEPVPDFYDEMDFGSRAWDVLMKVNRNPPNMLADTEAEPQVLQKKISELRTALREEVISEITGHPSEELYCRLCGGGKEIGSPERHSSDCPAAEGTPRRKVTEEEANEHAWKKFLAEDAAGPNPTFKDRFPLKGERDDE